MAGIHTNIAICILAGGQSRRMGQPKALLPYQGRPLIEHLIARCRLEADTVFVAGCPEPGLYRHLSVPVLADVMADTSGGFGPLGGIYTALRYINTSLNTGTDANGKPVQAVLCLPCDGWPLPVDFVQRMMTALQQHEIVFARDADRNQHLYCLIRCELQQPLLDYLNGGGRKVIDWFESRDYAVVNFNNFYFSNINTADDWREFISQ